MGLKKYRWQSPITLLFRPECGNSATVREFFKKRLCTCDITPPITVLVANKIPESAINSLGVCNSCGKTTKQRFKEIYTEDVK